jgi:hypothetical protein
MMSIKFITDKRVTIITTTTSMPITSTTSILPAPMPLPLRLWAFISLTACPSREYGDFSTLPRHTCIYIVCRKTLVLYVGKADDVRDRWLSGHHREDELRKNGATRIYLFHTLKPFLAGTEGAFINFFRPPANRRKEKATLIGRLSLLAFLLHPAMLIWCFFCWGYIGGRIMGV